MNNFLWRSLLLILALLLSACGNSDPSPPDTQRSQSKTSAAVINYGPMIQQLYIGYFGRPADPAGLAYYEKRYAEINAPQSIFALNDEYSRNAAIRGQVDTFATSKESQELYQGNDAVFIDRVYLQVFGRAPDADGKAFWLGTIQRGDLTRAGAVLSIIAGARGTDRTLMEKKMQLASTFTNSINTAEQSQIYGGSANLQIARTMLDAVTVETDATGFDRVAERALQQMTAQLGGYAEVAAPARKIAFIVDIQQGLANAARIEAFARNLAADLNARASAFGPVYSVNVLAAAATAAGVREQLKGHAGAILIGDVPVPKQTDLANGETVPYLDPFRLPNCGAYSFDSSGQQFIGTNEYILTDPNCRNGMTVSVLRGHAAATQLRDVGDKLDQFTRYHAASDTANAGWTPGYDLVHAMWSDGNPWDMDEEYYWSTVPLFSSQQIRYVKTGSAQERKAALLRCFSSNQEICSFNGHGAQNLIMFEGPGVYGDIAYLESGTLLNTPVNAKFVSLLSCSTQDYLHDGSFASTMLMSGKNLLTLGLTQVAVVSNSIEGENIAKRYVHLQFGATYADAFAGSMDSTPLSFQGDPYISARPVPKGPQPKLLIDGKHYNEGSGIVAMQMPATAVGAKSLQTITISNPGAAALKFRLNVFPFGQGINARSLNYPAGGAGGFALWKESPVTQGRSGGVDLGSIELTVLPGASQQVVYSFSPYSWANTVKDDEYGARFEILSNDPAAFHIFLEMRGKVK